MLEDVEIKGIEEDIEESDEEDNEHDSNEDNKEDYPTLERGMLFQAPRELD